MSNTIKARVDSGMLLLIDPCYLAKFIGEDVYQQICEAVLKNGATSWNGGTVFSTPHGDGLYLGNIEDDVLVLDLDPFAQALWEGSDDT